jgi:hypothetical protein
MTRTWTRIHGTSLAAESLQNPNLVDSGVRWQGDRSSSYLLSPPRSGFVKGYSTFVLQFSTFSLAFLRASVGKLISDVDDTVAEHMLLEVSKPKLGLRWCLR